MWQLLDGIGAIPSVFASASEYQATPDNYQDSVSEPTAFSEAEELCAPTSDVSNASAAHILVRLKKVIAVTKPYNIYSFPFLDMEDCLPCLVQPTA